MSETEDDLHSEAMKLAAAISAQMNGKDSAEAFTILTSATAHLFHAFGVPHSLALECLEMCLKGLEDVPTIPEIKRAQADTSAMMARVRRSS